jgi:hypothetical protein
LAASGGVRKVRSSGAAFWAKALGGATAIAAATPSTTRRVWIMGTRIDRFAA